MQNVFDRAAPVVFNTVTKTFGYEAHWQPLDVEIPLKVANVGYGEPIADQQIGSTGHFRSLVDEYQVYDYWMEYKQGDFVGLIESARNGDTEEVTIYSREFPSGRVFLVQEVKSVFDGRSFMAKLQIKEE